MKSLVGNCLSIAILALAMTLPASADESMVHQLRNPDLYLIARGPQPSAAEQERSREAYDQAMAKAKADQAAAVSSPVSTRERSAAVIPGDYTVIPNTTPGLLSNVSFIRFPNFNSEITTTTSVRMVGDATGRDYGTATVDSPPRSSPQLTINELYQSIGGVSFDPADTAITLYMQNNQLLTGVQHVYYNSISQFFENMSACSYVDGFSYIPMTSGVVNVHTSTLQSRFPSVVKVHNKNAFTRTIRLRIHDGPTGNLLGIMSFSALANSTYAFSSAAIEAAVGYIPTGANFHMNVFYDDDPALPTGFVITHTMTNVAVSGSVLNLTTICNINE